MCWHYITTARGSAIKELEESVHVNSHSNRLDVLGAVRMLKLIPCMIIVLSVALVVENEHRQHGGEG
jgi:hypothetical protein